MAGFIRFQRTIAVAAAGVLAFGIADRTSAVHVFEDGEFLNWTDSYMGSGGEHWAYME